MPKYIQDIPAPPPPPPPDEPDEPSSVVPGDGPVIGVNGDALEFDTDRIEAAGGGEVVFVFNNSSSLYQHNLVFVQAGQKDAVTESGGAVPGRRLAGPQRSRPHRRQRAAGPRPGRGSPVHRACRRHLPVRMHLSRAQRHHVWRLCSHAIEQSRKQCCSSSAHRTYRCRRDAIFRSFTCIRRKYLEPGGLLLLT